MGCSFKMMFIRVGFIRWMGKRFFIIVNEGVVIEMISLLIFVLEGSEK